MELPFVITIVGPESSGKTTLAKHLAEAIGCIWVPEYARMYLEGLNRPYVFEDLEVMARGQLELIQWAVGNWQLAVTGRQGAVGSHEWAVGSRQFSESNLQSTIAKEVINGLLQPNVTPADLVSHLKFIRESCLIVDSGLLSIRMWSYIRYGKTIDFVEQSLEEDLTSLYLLTRARKEWEPDPLREAPKLVDRVWIYNQYVSELSTKGLPFSIL